MCVTLLCSCSEKTASLKEKFYSQTVLSGLFCAYYESVENNALKPSSDSYAEDDIEYSYMTPDGIQTAHTPLSVSYRAIDGAFDISLKDRNYTFANGLSAEGYDVSNLTDKKAVQKVFDVFIKAFLQNTDNNDFITAPDSIRAAEEDVEVERITLKLDKDRYKKAFADALSALKNDVESKKYLTDLLGFYGSLHNREESAENILDALVNEFTDSVGKSDGQLVWQRYLKDGKAAAARLKFGDNVIRYICAEAETYTELDCSVSIGNINITAAYELRKTGMSDSYNVRISNGDEITYFDGKAESAYKSGNIGFELKATKNAAVINGLDLDLSFNGEKKLTYKGSGNITKKGEKKTFSFELVFNEG